MSTPEESRRASCPLVPLLSFATLRFLPFPVLLPRVNHRLCSPTPHSTSHPTHPLHSTHTHAYRLASVPLAGHAHISTPLRQSRLAALQCPQPRSACPRGSGLRTQSLPGRRHFDYHDRSAKPSLPPPALRGPPNSDRRRSWQNQWKQECSPAGLATTGRSHVGVSHCVA